jgi:hypothetical protein
MILNGVKPKSGRVPTGEIFTRVASNQHSATGVAGTSYESPFTASSVPPMGTQYDAATQVQQPALQAQSAGKVVPTSQYQKVHPSEKSATFNRTTPVKLVNPGGGGSPNIGNDTPANPNQRPKPTVPPVVYPTTASEKIPPGTGSFLHVGSGTIGATENVSTSASRWDTVKKGAAG